MPETFLAKFDFDLARAVLEQLVETFDLIEGTGPLTRQVLSELDHVPGVYQLYRAGVLMYVGKADNDLAARLGEHLTTLSGRKHIDLAAMTFRALSLHRNWAPLTHESLLIRHYRGAGQCEWNTTGIGNHDPGRRREDWDPNRFDTQFPINELWPCVEVPAGEYNASQLLQTIKGSLPYVFRYQTDGSLARGHADYNTLSITVPTSSMPAEELLKLIVGHLPGWQATVFPSHMILYKENAAYRSGRKVIP